MFHTLICIDKLSTWDYLTSYKIYDVIDSFKYLFVVIDDAGRESTYPKELFITLEEWREKQLNQILK